MPALTPPSPKASGSFRSPLFTPSTDPTMTFAHLALGSRDVQATSEFLCAVMGWSPIPTPSNALQQLAWIDLSPHRDQSQQIHVIYTPDFEVSAFEREFGRHLAVFHPGHDMQALRERIVAHGGQLVAPQRETPFERFFFREPVNGYILEVIHHEQWREEQ